MTACHLPRDHCSFWRNLSVKVKLGYATLRSCHVAVTYSISEFGVLIFFFRKLFTGFGNMPGTSKYIKFISLNALAEIFLYLYVITRYINLPL